MGRYASWLHVKPHVQDYEAQPDQARMNVSIGWAEDRVDGLLRKRYTVPFTEASHPNSFSILRKVVALWAAAEYLVTARQTEKGPEPPTWYPDRLVTRGQGLLDQFLTGTPPDDAPAADDEFSELPQDGYSGLTTTQQTDTTPIFKRGHLISGDSRHW